ncbi:M23 family metallopeptidase [Stella sp.]|uniref:M23 family metallopeptidase n=1 Tax=Stella sp. TaxID=2912054 RepID=UPI0035B30901
MFASFLGTTSAIVLAAAVAALIPASSPALAAPTERAAGIPQKKPVPTAAKARPAAVPAAKPAGIKPSLTKAAAATPAAKPLTFQGRPATLPTGKPAAKAVAPGKAKPGGKAAAVRPASFLARPAAATRALYRPASAPAAAADQDRRVLALVEEDETLIDVLVRENVDVDDLIAAVDAFEDIEERQRLVPGDRIELVLDGANAAGERSLAALRVIRAQGGDVTLARGRDGSFTASEGADPRAARFVTMTGTVSDDWRQSMARAEVPTDLMAEIDRLLALDADLPRPVPQGATFEILAERREGQGRATSHIARYVGVRVAGYDHRIYRYMPQDGAAGYFDEHGRSVAPLTLATPVADARLTSEFGWRKHPKLKRRMFHRGIDLAAPIGTPIVASADGTVEWAGWRGAYGRYVRLTHGSGLSTGYGHLSDYAPGVTEGATVRQGQVIGYVGSSGRSTGPHLDFSVLVDGRPVNPMHALMPAPRDLRGPELVAFREHVAQIATLAQATP